MGKVKVLFVWPHNIAGEIVDFVEGPGEDPAHVAVFACGGLLEAIREGVVISDVNKYDGLKTRIVTVEVPYPEHGEIAGYLMEGRRYGLFTSCLSAAIYEQTGATLSIGSTDSADCSEVGTIYLRCCGLNVLPRLPAKCIDPKILLAELEPLDCEVAS